MDEAATRIWELHDSGHAAGAEDARRAWASAGCWIRPAHVLPRDELGRRVWLVGYATGFAEFNHVISHAGGESPGHDGIHVGAEPDLISPPPRR